MVISRRRSARWRRRALHVMAGAVILLALDLLEPGWGRFPNLLFYGRWAIHEATEVARRRLGDSEQTSLADQRLTPCQQESDGNRRYALSDTQAALRHTLTGQSSVSAVQQLGTPVCQLADGAWRWLLSNGLALDVQVANDGTVTHVELTTR